MSHSLSQADRLVAESIPGVLLRYTLHADGSEATQVLNSRCPQLFELQAATIEADTGRLWQLLSPAALLQLRESLRQSAEALSPWQHEWAIATPSGVSKWLQGSGLPDRRAADAAVVWHLVILDISKARRAELALRRSDKRFQALIEGLELVSVQGYDRERRVIVWNKGSENLYGYSRAEAMGQRLEDLIIPPAMVAGMLVATAEWMSTGVVSRPSEHLALRHKDGRPVQVFSSHTMQVNSRGEAELYCVDVDLSERQALEAKLREAHKLEAIGRLAGGIAHDFNNVLGGLLANVMLARELLPPPHAAQRHLQLIARGGEHARELVQQILAFSRRQPQALEALSLRPLVRDGVSLLRATLPPGVELQLKLRDGGLLVSADATQLQQVLMNLCSNAWQALQGRPGRVEIGLESLRVDAGSPAAAAEPGAGRWAHLWVRDEGSGMDEHTRAHLFEPFFTTKPPGQGTGLGLAVVHGIVLAHHGAIRVESIPGQGSCFHLYLPLLETPAPDTVDDALRAPDLVAPTRLSGGRHVLYLDDDEVMRLTVQSLLQRSGCRVSLFERAQAALQAVAADPDGFDLVVTDFNMPDLSGVQVARVLATIRPDLPVLLTSGYWTDELYAEARAAGVRAVLRKERSVEELAALVHSILG